MPEKIGLWLVGARGGVATTAIVGLEALRLGLAPTLGLVTELPQFAAADLASWGEWLVGGHEIRAGSLVESAQRLAAERVLPADLLPPITAALTAIDARIRPGILYASGPATEELADDSVSRRPKSARNAIDAIQADLREFQATHQLRQVVVVFVASTEPETDTSALPSDWTTLEKQLNAPACALRASSLYAIAALELGLPFVNFTPSLGATCAAIEELARKKNSCHAGRDARTGETLMKTVLAPMFAARNLAVQSWVGHNIFGNLDGRVLDHPAHKKSKVDSKDQVLGELLGYLPQTLVSIEYIASLGDWKTAWDHVHFRGFLGVPMTLQFTWQGCDSALAAPLLLDLARLMDLAARRGQTGAVSELASFFKSPVGDASCDFFAQFQMLAKWVAQTS